MFLLNNEQGTEEQGGDQKPLGKCQMWHSMYTGGRIIPITIKEGCLSEVMDTAIEMGMFLHVVLCTMTREH